MATATLTLRNQLRAREPPHLRDKRWDSILVDGHSEPTRVQSIICFDTRPDIDIENLSQTPYRLWANTREYLHTIPGLVDFKLARSCSNADAYCLLLQWSSEAGWARFQSSLGLQLLMGVLDGQVANSTTCDTSVAEVGKPGQEFELIAFKFSSSCECSETDCEEFKSSSSCICAEIHRDDFKQNWCALAENTLQLNHLTIKGDWLESNFTKGGRRVSRKEPPKIFLGVITPVIGMKMATNSLFESELEKFSPKADLGLSRERFRILESGNFPKGDNERSSEPMIPPSNPLVSEVGVTTLAELMEVKTLPHYTDVRAVRKNYRLISEEKKKKLEDQQDGKTYYEPPEFQFRALGDMCHRPWSKPWKQKINPKFQRRGVMDLISFRYDGSEQVEAAFEALCLEISNSRTVFRFQEEGKEHQLSFILNRPTHDTQDSVQSTSEAGIKYDGPVASRTSAKEKLRQSSEAKWRETMSLVEDFASRYHLSYEKLSFPNYSRDGFLPESILEVTRFHVVITDKELFETIFERYHLTFSDLHDPLQVFTNPPIPVNHKNKACNGDYHGGWQEQDNDPLHHNKAATPSSIDESPSQDLSEIQSQTAIFLAAVSWRNSTARTGWYKEFAAQMDTYEAFGSKIHALQLLMQQQQVKDHPPAAPVVVSRLFHLLKTYTVEQKDPLLGFHGVDLEMALGRFRKKGKVLMKC